MHGEDWGERNKRVEVHGSLKTKLVSVPKLANSHRFLIQINRRFKQFRKVIFL